MLSAALREAGNSARSLRVRWDTEGWKQAMRKLRSEVSPGDILLLQYTSPQWRRRYGPVGAWSVARTGRRAGAKVGLIIHDPFAPNFGPGWRSRSVGTFERLLLRLVARSFYATFVTIDPSLLPRGYGRLTFLPTGTNIRPTSSALPHEAFTVAVFGVMGNDGRDAMSIAGCLEQVSRRVSGLRLCVFGRGADQAAPLIRAALDGHPVEVSIEGLLPAVQVSERLSGADMLLFLRDSVSSRHGTIAAALAHGLPVVGFRGRETGPPLAEAGVLLVRAGDFEGICDAIVEIATTPGLVEELRARSLKASEAWLAWPRLAEVVQRAFA